MIKLEEGKYYRTADGRRVGPARITEARVVDKWALWANDGKTYEVVGVTPERAFDTELVAEWTDEPKLWRDMTPEEKGELLLAHHEGKVIDAYSTRYKVWVEVKPNWYNQTAYRIRPEPERKTVKFYGSVDRDHDGNLHFFNLPYDRQTHTVTFDVIDGEPDTSSIKMEKL